MINLSVDERQAIESMDEDALREAIEEARLGRGSSALSRLQLCRLGAYVQSTESRFIAALDDFRKAKSAAKIASTERSAISAGWKLSSAVDQMKARARQEKVDHECFYVDDHIYEPISYRPEMTVSVSYRWRATDSEDWNCGRITFRHSYTAHPLETITDRRKLTKRNERKSLKKSFGGSGLTCATLLSSA